MATSLQALRMMRKMCLSLPNSNEAEHFGEVCFRVGKRMFATCGEKDGVCRLVFQLEPGHARRLVASDTRFEPYSHHKDGVQIDADDVWDWDEVYALVFESYRLNDREKTPRRKATRKSRKKIGRKSR